MLLACATGLLDPNETAPETAPHQAFLDARSGSIDTTLHPESRPEDSNEWHPPQTQDERFQYFQTRVAQLKSAPRCALPCCGLIRRVARRSSRSAGRKR
eukprot:2373799-Rhodomonas_salina.2